ncbi:MAG TPA: M1 family aminopeptidase [Bryobacteraceae bacterium]
MCRGCHIAILGAFGLFAASRALPAPPTGASIAADIAGLSIDPHQSYHVYDLRLERGGASIYLTDGVLSFTAPVDGRIIAAVFTSAEVETGDAEILLMPPRASERASLAAFAKTPNVDEHFTSALLVFTDNTARQLQAQIQANPFHKLLRRAPEAAQNVVALFHNASAQVNTDIVDDLLSAKKPARGFFYAAMAGRTLGTFEFLYQPDQFEPVTLGRVISSNVHTRFQLWTAFRPLHAPPYRPPPAEISAYRLDTTIHPDLSLSARAVLTLTAPADCGRVLRFEMSNRLQVSAATVDGKAVEVFQRPAMHNSISGGESAFLLISVTPFVPGATYTVALQYHGSVIRQMADGSYAVADRNTWYPFLTPTFATFDLTFRCPANLNLVSTGELVSQTVQNGERIVHRKTAVPEHVAGFNLGNYQVARDQHSGYRIACYANTQMQEKGEDSPLPEILKHTENILDDYTRLWGPLPIHNIAISPVPGYFGQGFAGMIYLSSMSYVPLARRPKALRGPRQDAFFSDLLLPHEVSHQWWGNIVRAGNYRSAWLIEAMAEDSALQYVKRTQGSAAENAVLARYRADLLKRRNGGPVDFGVRLLNTAGFSAWEIIVYEKGAWILHMLRGRLGDRGFHKMQLAMLSQYAAKPISDEDFRRLASKFVPAGQRDRSLTDFFDSWIYGTGIPTLHLHGAGPNASLAMSGVDDEFTVEVPLACRSRGGKSETRWVRADTGNNALNLPRGETCRLPSPSRFLYTQ